MIESFPKVRGLLVAVMIVEAQQDVTVEDWTTVGGVAMNPGFFGDRGMFRGRLTGAVTGDDFDWRVLQEGVEFDSGSMSLTSGWEVIGEWVDGGFATSAKIYDLQLRLQAGGSSVSIKYTTLALVESP